MPLIIYSLLLLVILVQASLLYSAYNTRKAGGMKITAGKQGSKQVNVQLYTASGVTSLVISTKLANQVADAMLGLVEQLDEEERALARATRRKRRISEPSSQLEKVVPIRPAKTDTD